ncbi:unnamed protein product [Rotaria sp. Silwood2]|nr:unnamed protein product [Rotaria sp. Silwood2]
MKASTLAVKAAIQHVPDFATHVPSCVDFSIASSSAKIGLTKEDVAAIKTYTAECPVYKLLNTALRSEQLKNIEPWFPYLKLLHIAISKLHPKKGTYCRGIGGNLSSLYPVGSTVIWWGVSSISAKVDVCMRFLAKDIYGNYNGTLFTILSSSARSIVDFSQYPEEEESILLPATNIKVISKNPSLKYKGLSEIKVEEIETVSHGKSVIYKSVFFQSNELKTSQE